MTTKTSNNDRGATACPELALRATQYAFWATFGAVYGLFVISAFAYARFGGPWVQQLSGSIGEAIAERAQGLDNAGRTEEAIEMYRQALAVGFDDPFQYLVTSDRFVDVLLREKRYEEAVIVTRETLTVNRESWRPYDQLHVALTALGRHQEALDAAQDWLKLAEEKKHPDHIAWASHAVEQSRQAVSARKGP